MVRKLQGLYFEDYQIGDKFETPGRTVTDAEISAYAGISMDFNPIHTDEQYAKDTIYQNPYRPRHVDSHHRLWAAHAPGAAGGDRHGSPGHQRQIREASPYRGHHQHQG